MLVVVSSVSIAGEVALEKESANAFYAARSPFVLLRDLKLLHVWNPGFSGKIILPPYNRKVQGNWITREQALELLRMSGDETPCLRAVNPLASVSLDGPSTVGSEALRLVLGFLDGAYPPVAPGQLDAEVLLRRVQGLEIE